MQTDRYRNFKLFKLIQMILLIVFGVSFFCYLKFDPLLRNNIYSNRNLLTICVFLWAFMIYSVVCLAADYKQLEKEILELKAKVKAKDLIIGHLKDVLSGIDPAAPKEKILGRKPVPEDQKKRIRKYRKDGYTIKEIADMEGVSLGAVSNICKGIKKRKKEDK